MNGWWGWFALIMLGVGFLFAITGVLDTLAEIKGIEKPDSGGDEDGRNNS